jgi:hypothetical protein
VGWKPPSNLANLANRTGSRLVPHTRGTPYTNINFWRGAELAERLDTEWVLLGWVGKMRHLRFASASEIQPPGLMLLARAAAELN